MNKHLKYLRTELVVVWNFPSLVLYRSEGEVLLRSISYQYAAHAETNVPTRTLCSWVARSNEAEAKYGTGYVGLLPQTGRSGNRTRKAPQDTHGLLDTFIAEQFETPTQPHARAVYHAYCHEYQKRGLAVLSEWTFYRRLNLRRGTEQTARRKGARAAYQGSPWYWELSRSTPRHGDRPWEIVHIDYTELDIEVCTSMGRVLGRPWATFATDAYSRRLLGCYLSFDPPSYRSCMVVLRVCVRRHLRFPQSIVVDAHAAEQKLHYIESSREHLWSLLGMSGISLSEVRPSPDASSTSRAEDAPPADAPTKPTKGRVGQRAPSRDPVGETSPQEEKATRCAFSVVIELTQDQMTAASIAQVECPECGAMRTLHSQGGQ